MFCYMLCQCFRNKKKILDILEAYYLIGFGVFIKFAQTKKNLKHVYQFTTSKKLFRAFEIFSFDSNEIRAIEGSLYHL